MSGLNDLTSLYQQGGFAVNPYVQRNPQPYVPYGATGPGSSVVPTQPAQPTQPTQPAPNTGYGRNDPNSPNYDPGGFNPAVLDVQRPPAGAPVQQPPVGAPVQQPQGNRTATPGRDPNANQDVQLESLAGPNARIREGRQGVVRNARRQADIMRGTQRTVQGVMEGPTGQGANADMFNRENRQAANLGRTDAFRSGVNAGANAGVSQQFRNEVDNVRNLGRTDAFRSAINSNVRGDQTTNQFDRAVNQATQNNVDARMADRLRENVLQQVMPAVNSTFAGSGMTGSGLHQQNLAAGVSSGLAGVEAEMMNRALDRALQAGGMSQSAFSEAQNRALTAGNMNQQDALARAGMGLSAAGQEQQFGNQAIGLNMQAGQMNQADALARAGLGMQAGQNMQGARENAINRQLGAAGLQANLSGQSSNPYREIGEVGMGQRADTQAAYDDAIRRNIAQQEMPIQAISNYLNLVSNLGGQFQSQQGTTSQSPGILGLLGLGFQGAGLLSDRRAKTDIEVVGNIDGLTLYSYRYKGQTDRNLGFMADEVEAVAPWAVTEANGMKHVNYGAI